ncbi:MAG: GTP cyclohydrolase [Saprospiraceae bacterium]|nr:GTP cyclohydrolase [Saprospiraceae bacterium]
MIRIILVIACSAFAFSLFAQEAPTVKIKRENKEIYRKQDSIYNWRIHQSRLDGRYIPKDLNDCFRELDKLMDEDTQAEFMAFSDEEVDSKTHRTLGKWIEVNWSLVEGSRLSSYFNKMRVPHYDYMIGIIIQSYHRKLHGRDIKLKEQVLRFRAIWAKKQEEEAKKMLENGESK